MSKEPKTIGEHLRKRRLELGMTLKELGRVEVCLGEMRRQPVKTLTME